jgi:hypothetical protein
MPSSQALTEVAELAPPFPAGVVEPLAESRGEFTVLGNDFSFDAVMTKCKRSEAAMPAQRRPTKRSLTASR